MKRLFKIIGVLCIILFMLDFIPIKLAVKLENAVPLKSNEYLCSFTQVTGGNWLSENNLQNYKNNQLYFEYLEGQNPFNILDKNFSTDYLEPSGNKYILTGTVIQREHDIYDLDVEKWEIVYPIHRKSLRLLYVPANYLTIYDFDVVKQLFGNYTERKTQRDGSIVS